MLLMTYPISVPILSVISYHDLLRSITIYYYIYIYYYLLLSIIIYYYILLSILSIALHSIISSMISYYHPIIIQNIIKSLNHPIDIPI
jgi:hypothetical protein